VYSFASEDVSVAQLLANWLDQDWEAKFLVDDQLQLLWQNRAGSHWLSKAGSPLKLAAGRLVAHDSKLQTRLTASFDECRSHSRISTAVTKCQEGQDDLLLRMRHIGQLGGHLTFELSVRQLSAANSHELAGLREAFQLTTTEEAVLLQMTKGLTVEAIANATGSSAETIRTHVRRVYSKMGVSSREEMFSRVRPFIYARHNVPPL
jgi:DNA-binding CsgD family transcriptional regulator